MNIEISGQSVELLKEKALWIPKEKVLVIGDLHFGKINHFRRSGLPVPPGVSKKNTETLIDLVTRMRPDRTLFLGDLFHSHYNEEWETVGQVIRHFTACEFILVRGNHDVMSAVQYERQQIKLHDQYKLNNLLFTHEPMEISMMDPAEFNIAGHIHPGAHLIGRGRQSVTLPCFWLTKNQMILPAFGTFTGMGMVHPQENDRVFIVLEDKVIEADLSRLNIES